MIPVPIPAEDAVPVHATSTVNLDPGEKATITITPETSGSLHYIPTVAATKYSQASYRVAADGTDRFGPSSVPPTDIDDMSVTFLPAMQFQRRVEVTVKDLRSSGGLRTYHVQVMGWEAA